MTDDNYKDMVINHDKHIDSLTSSVRVLADGIHASNKKLDDVIEAIMKQTVLAERVDNLNRDAKESFDRVHKRVDSLEKGAREIVAKSTIQWFVGFLLAGVLTLLTFIGAQKSIIKTDVKDLQVLAGEKIHMQRERNINDDVRHKAAIQVLNRHIERSADIRDHINERLTTLEAHEDMLNKKEK